MNKSKKAFNKGIKKGLNKEISTITISEAVFQQIMSLVYLFVPSDRISELERMIDERNSALNECLYGRVDYTK